MNVSVRWRCARAAVVEIDDTEYFELADSWEVSVNGVPQGTTDRVETYVDNLVPGSRNQVTFTCGERVESVGITTPAEVCTLDVRDFGAIGDGVRDDTVSIQAAIMACPAGGRVLVPAGSYLVTSLFLKSDIDIELAQGACVRARFDRKNLAYMPGTQQVTEHGGYAGSGMLPLGTWEGSSMSEYCSLITGFGVSNVCIYGRGCIDGQATHDEGNWWHDPKAIVNHEVDREIARPRMVFLTKCSHVALAGITVQNSPAWNIHPVLCDHVEGLCLTINSRKDSPNTDGFNPESCSYVRILGCHFSVGDDCIAIKSGKLDMPRALRPATHDMYVAHCYMHDGHGSVVIGSEAAGGVKDLLVRKCVFARTDRGLRVKTRRGRGKDAVNEGIVFDDIRMRDVLVPFVINSFYFCDVDGKSDYVQNRSALPVDDRTPRVGSVTFSNIEALSCHAAAGYITGLPESKIDRLELKNVHVTFADDPQPFVPAMACGVEEMCRAGFIAEHVETLVLENVTIEGAEGEPFVLDDVDRVENL